MHAAVLLPLFERDGGYHLVLTRRSYQLARDGGVICFPGGGVESSDPNLTQTALRETHEEIGVAPEDVRVLGRHRALLHALRLRHPPRRA